MRTEELFEIIGDIDDEKISVAGDFVRKKTHRVFIKWGALAACFLIVAAASVYVSKEPPSGGYDVKKTENISVASPSADIKEKGTATENAPEKAVIPKKKTEVNGETSQTAQYSAEITEEKAAADSARTEEASSYDDVAADRIPASGDGGGRTSHSAYKEAVTSENLSQNTKAFFGGSYIDGNGDYVIIITEDSAENRKSIAGELGIREDEAVFKKGEYTLAYLTKLQSQISQAMKDGELPFVMTSAVMEASNKIEVGVTNDDETLLDRVRAFDSIGGAIEFKIISKQAVNDIIYKQN